MARPHVIGCSVYGGRSPRTGKPVGERHRWSGGGWGIGKCIYCGRDLDQVLAKPTPELTLTRALANNAAEVAKSEWHPYCWSGDMGITKGWYIKRARASGGTEWLMDPAGVPVRDDSEAGALRIVASLAPETTN